MSAIGMPSQLLALFAPRPPLEYIAPKKKRRITESDGLGNWLSQFEETEPPPVEPFEAPRERRARQKLEREKIAEQKLAEMRLSYKADADPDQVKTAEPAKTLFVGRLSYESTEKQVMKLFETFGPIRDLRIVSDKSGKPRGYAFVEFERLDDCKRAYREADGRRLDGRRILVDMERARVQENWFPRRLGGGRGPQRMGVAKPKQQQQTLAQTLPTEATGQNSGYPSGRFGGSGRPAPFENRDFSSRASMARPYPSSAPHGGGGGYYHGGDRGGFAPRDSGREASGREGASGGNSYRPVMSSRNYRPQPPASGGPGGIQSQRGGRYGGNGSRPPPNRPFDDNWKRESVGGGPRNSSWTATNPSSPQE